MESMELVVSRSTKEMGVGSSFSCPMMEGSIAA